MMHDPSNENCKRHGTNAMHPVGCTCNDAWERSLVKYLSSRELLMVVRRRGDVPRDRAVAVLVGDGQ